MKGEAYIARAVALQVVKAVKNGGHFFCEQLPQMDINHFFECLREDPVNLESISLAIAGYEITNEKLRNLVRDLNIREGKIAIDLHIAAKWRNEPQDHPNIVALAKGRNPGVSTLAHFNRGDTRVFARDVLCWALKTQSKFASTEPQRMLLRELAENSNLFPLISLDSVANFLATWANHRVKDELNAPRSALPHLGLLADRNVLNSPANIPERLLDNLNLTQEIAIMSGSKFEEIRSNIERKATGKENKQKLEVLKRASNFHRLCNFESRSALEFEDARSLFKKSGSKNPQPKKRKQKGPDLTARGAELLIDDKNDDLQRMVNKISTALQDAVDNENSEAVGEIDNEDSTETHEFEIEIEKDILNWVNYFCSIDTWGGFFETRTTEFDEAINNFTQWSPIPLEPLGESISHDGEQYSLEQLLSAMQNALERSKDISLPLCELWENVVSTRAEILNSLNSLVHLPMLALAGTPNLRHAITNLLSVWHDFYAILEQNYATMDEIDYTWTRLIFDVVISLDIVQIKVKLDGGKYSWKAVLLPTHPLHLWRYERIATLTQGLKLKGSDRRAVIEQLKNPEHYLGAIYLSSIPDGRGANQFLPLSQDHRGLAVFENLHNAYSGSDGIDDLHDCIRNFVHIYPNHTYPLRLALINPPDTGNLLIGLLNGRQGRKKVNVPMVVDIYATPKQENRLLNARRYSNKDRDEIEEHIATGNLQLQVKNEVRPLEDLLLELKESPVHIVATFDEATTEMRYQNSSFNNTLPMSPFAIRKRIFLQGIKHKVELRPSQEESVFRSFYDMLAKFRQTEANQTPQASADAEHIATRIKESLGYPPPSATIRFFFADRALPSPERVNAARIMERRDSRRQSVCYDANYERLALLLRRDLSTFNLNISIAELQQFLRESVSLVGDSLIHLFNNNAQTNSNEVRGLSGMLLAARDYRDRYPDTLLVSVDTKLARLWLRLSDSAQRCDLIALRSEDDLLIVDAIEVKTSGMSDGVPTSEVEKAKQQLLNTLEAIDEGLKIDEHGNPLSAPRNEMLKEVFVSGCQSLTTSEKDRDRWFSWLVKLFGQIEANCKFQLAGLIYAVELSNNNRSEFANIEQDPFIINIQRLREGRIQKLIQSNHSDLPSKNIEDFDEQPPTEGSDSPTQTSDEIKNIKDLTDKENFPPTNKTLPRTSMNGNVGIKFQVGSGINTDSSNSYYLHPSNTELNQINIGIVGDLGTGKTQLTKALIYEFTRHSEANRGHSPKFLIFDYKRDYTKEDFVTAVNARVVVPHKIPLNIFDIAKINPERPQLARLGRAKFLNDVLQKIYGGVGHRQRNQVKNAVMRGYELQPGRAPTLTEVLTEYQQISGDKIDACYSILSDLVDFEVFVDCVNHTQPFEEFFTGVTVIDLAELGIGDKERNMLLVLLLNFYYEYMTNLSKKDYVGTNPQCRFIDSMVLVDEADNIMKYNFEVLRKILLQGREFGIGVLLASQYLSHFKTQGFDYSEPLLTWFIHKIPNVTIRDLQSIGLTRVTPSMVQKIKSLEVHQCLYKTLDVPGQFMRGVPFFETEY